MITTTIDIMKLDEIYIVGIFVIRRFQHYVHSVLL